MKYISKLFLLLPLTIFSISCNSFKTGIEKEQKVLIQTTLGDITLKLYNETPLHRDNFIKLVNEKIYDGVLFHRVINQFMVQTGDPTSKTASRGEKLGEGDMDYTIPAEIKTPKLYHKYGAIAAARQGDDINPEKASSGAQFYIVTGKKYSEFAINEMQDKMIVRYGHANDSTYKYSPQAKADYKTIGGTPHLDGNYTVFGEVVKGMNVVEKIQETRTDETDRPIQDVRILKMELIR